MARIDYKDGLWWGIGSWAEKDIFKLAGFVWSPKRKAWITDSLEIADRADPVFWSGRALDEIERRDIVAEASWEMSYQASTMEVYPAPEGKAFKPFQNGGIEYALLRKDTLIGDPPGLGKTVMAIGCANADDRINQILVICPASLKENWRRHFEAWKTRPLTVGIADTRRREMVADGVYKSGKQKGQVRYKKVIHPNWWPDTDVVIINYDILERFSDQIHDRIWDMLVCDEVHALKTETSGRSLFVYGGKKVIPKDKSKSGKRETLWFKAIDCHRRLFLSGTPMLNRPIELWPICKAFDPDGLGRSWNDFVYDYCDAYTAQFGLDVSGASRKKELGARLRERFMVRRSKKEVLPELPPVFRQVILLDSPEIRDLVAREDEIAQALRLYETNMLAAEETEEQRDRRLGDQIIDQVFKFGFDKSDDPDKPNSRAINLSYAAAVLGLEPPAVAILFEEMAAVRRELGLAKVSAMTPWLNDFLDAGEKLICFSYHSDVVRALADATSRFNPAVIYGKTPVHKRQGEVDYFQDDESCRILHGNIDAAGVGYTMTRSKDVAFAEGDWVPTKMWQCEDRACRIGQTADKIMSFYLVANGSLDSRIAQSAQDKADTIDEVMDSR